MDRRHLFDNGFPVSARTLLAGSLVLVAISHRSLHLSRRRLASSLVDMADTSARVLRTLARQASTRVAIRDSRENYAKLATYGRCISSPAERSEAHPHLEPEHSAERAQPHKP